MKKIFLTGFWMFVFTVLFSSTALAQTKNKATIKLPTFMAGEVQIVNKNIDGDLMIAGKEVKVVSNVNGDTYVAGGNIEINGEINGNLIVAGGKVIISGKVSKNLIMAGGEVSVNDSAKISGYVLIGGKKVNLLGNFMGPVKLGAESLIVGKKAVIGGNLDADVSISEISSTAKITGEKNIKIYEVKKPEIQTNQWKKLGYVGKVVSFLSKLLILLILVRLFGQKIKQINIKNSFWSAIGLGLVVLIVIPILALMLMITIVAIPLSIIILTTYFVGLYLSTIISSIFVGNFISEKVHFKANNYAQGAIGLLLISLIGLIPVVGGLVKLIIFLFGVGIIFKSFKQYFSKNRL